ncbi:hypothetical protein [Loktanella sp. M215]|uniref:hypothetical protein n=1 Tax=Loktanella sp. M215 TaxID=2675431 RepID=UPI001F2FE484|nr:hypothetical protein [Loktanella sp. M215]MCF7702165.1 hypothetical protein [Loktanella sp. M215]
MKCIIYLGHHKTGSSALQEMFTRNAGVLLEDGILYPFVEPQGQAYARALLAGGDPDAGLTFKVKSPHNHIGYVMQTEALAGNFIPDRYQPLPTAAQMFQSIRDDLARTGARTLLLCSEVFSQYGTRQPALVGRMLEALGIADVSLYMTLRRPDLHLAAWFSQMLKFGRRPRLLSEGGAADLYRTAHFDFERAVRPWADAVPRGKLFVHSYDAVMAAGGSEPHFTRTFGIDTARFVPAGGPVNPSIPYALYDLILRANRELPAPVARSMQRALLAHRQRMTLPPNAEIELFGSAVRAEMTARFAPMQTYLGGLVGRAGFFDDFEAMPDTLAVPLAEVAGDAATQARAVLTGHRPQAAALAWLNGTGI